MSKTYLDYTIHLTDKDQVHALQVAEPLIHLARNSTPGSWRTATGIIASLLGARFTGEAYGGPASAAVRYSAPIIPFGHEVTAPCITSPWITDLAQTNYPVDLDDFDRDRGGFFGSIADFFNSNKFIWRGSFAFTNVAVTALPDPAGGGDVPVEAIMQRRWVEGFEHPEQGEGGTGGGLALYFTRAASRHVDGFGLAIRGTDGVKTHTTAELGAAASNKTWERLYIRLVQLPTGAVTFWRARGTAGAMGVQLAITAGGRITINDTDNSSTQTQIGQTAVLERNRWYCLDMIFGFGAAAGFKLFIDKVESVNIVSVGAGGLATVTNHISSEVGSSGFGSRGLGLDLDDWMAAEQPVLFTGNDFLNGSKMVRVSGKAFSADMADWAGDWRSAAQVPAEDAVDTLDSSTSGARLAIDTNGEQAIDGESGSIGCVAIAVVKYGTRAGTDDGTLGYSIAGAADVLAAIVESNTARWNTKLYRPTGLITPAPVTPLKIIHEKGASTSLAHVYAFAATAELIGVFGQEDIAPSAAGATPAAAPAGTGIHNAPYPRTAWASRGVKPISPVIIVSGTYVGNGVGQDIAFRAPVNWFFVRRVNNANNGTWWFSSQLAAHEGFKETFEPEGMIEALIDPNFHGTTGGTDDQAQQTIIRITGDTDQVNKNGDAYQYIAFCDPGMRFLLNAALTYPVGSSDKTTTLVNTNFLPAAMFLTRETMNGGSGVETWYKGPGHATQSISKLSASETASAIAFARGSLLSRSAIHFAGVGQEIAVSLWRSDDGSADPGVPKVVKIGTYTGDGTGNRTIALTPASTVRPVWALVVPHDAAAVFRDAAHTGTISVTVPASTSTVNGIRGGGVDQLLVGSDLNANGTVYDYFVLMGSATAGNNGFSGNGEFVPVVPAVPVDGPFLDGPTGDPSAVELPDDGGSSNPIGQAGGDDFGTQCVSASTQVMNTALARIGVTSPILDIVGELTVEAQMCRLHYADDVEAVLAEFPWQFATGYATLALVGGSETSPLNNDWTYSYRAPADMVKARRLSRAGIGRALDSDPPKFKLGKDATGALLFTNEPDPQLEYTFRPTCAASAGDALFRDALGWRHAMRLAPSLAKNKIKAAECWQMYLQTLNIAAASNAGEQQQDPKNTGGDASWISARG